MERVNRTLKSNLYRYFTVVNSLHYVDILQDLVDSYNNTYHRSIGRAPATVSLFNSNNVRTFYLLQFFFIECTFDWSF